MQLFVLKFERRIFAKTFILRKGRFAVLFRDRMDAGEQLAEAIGLLDVKNVVILSLPRGGIPLVKIIAKKQGAPLDIILAKKIGHPTNPEYAIGAIAEGGTPILGDGYVEKLHAQWVQKEIPFIRVEMARKRTLYRESLKDSTLKDKNVVIVDDGIATGLTMFAAIKAVKEAGPKSVSVAVPVIPKTIYEQLKQTVDKVYAVKAPDDFLGGVGAYYASFPQLKDEQVKEILKS